MYVTHIGMDLAKSVFSVHGVDQHGKTAVRKTLRRAQVRKWFAQLPACTVGMESCGGAHFWARELSKLGHRVRLINPRFVKPFLKSHKNDRKRSANHRGCKPEGVVERGLGGPGPDRSIAARAGLAAGSAVGGLDVLGIGAPRQ
jgi:hypothetical protein